METSRRSHLPLPRISKGAPGLSKWDLYQTSLWCICVVTSDNQPSDAWPATTYEAHPWVRAGDEVASRLAKLQAPGDYRAAVPPFIAAIPVALPAEVIALADDASQELARFDAEAGTIAAPFASILLRSESASSSEVENLTSSAKQVALAEIGESKSSNARLVLANVRAMTAAIALSDQLDEHSIIAMHDALLRDTAPESATGATNKYGSAAAVFRRRLQRLCRPTTRAFPD